MGREEHARLAVKLIEEQLLSPPRLSRRPT